MRAAVRPGASIRQRLAGTRAVDPLANRAFADARFAPDPARRPAQLQDLVTNFCSTMRRRILVDVHPAILFIELACVATTSFDESPLMEHPCRRLVKLHS
jgi:hypothetical protein